MNRISIGVLTYDTVNLGDWTQTSAALYVWWHYFKKPQTFKKFIEECIETSMIQDYPITWINRDSMSLVEKPENIDKVIILCNAWWMHKKDDIYNFVPPNWITPIYTSMHIYNSDVVDIKVIEHLKQFEPIGCRDISTKILLEKNNIKAYFSGCLTMLFDFKIDNFGFNQTVDYSNNHIHIDVPVLYNSKNIIYKSQHRSSDINDKNKLLSCLQDMINYMNSPWIVTSRLQIWLPLSCNNIPVSLINLHNGQKIGNGDPDNSGQEINRFNGLTEIVYEKTNLEAFKKTLLNETLDKINVLINNVV